MTAPTAPGPLVVDPRFRQRRISVRKQAGRRRLKRLLVLIVVALVSLATVIVLRSPILDVDAVTVEGAAHTDVETIVEVAGISTGAPILLADLDGAEAAIESLPWVADAQVSRVLPGDVRVRVTEREATAVVSGSGRAVLVDVAGHVLAEAPPTAVPPYVHVVMPDAPPEIGAQVDPTIGVAVDLASRLRINPAGSVSSILVQPTLRFRLVSGGLVELGPPTELDDKLDAFRTVYARVDQTCLAVLDLRVPTHPVLTRDPGC